MNLNTHRSWITPLVIGAFLLSAITGTLMFFHLDSGWNKLAHEWLSWALVGSVVLHVLLNWASFRRHLSQSVGRLVIGTFVALLALSFIPMSGRTGNEPPFAQPVRTLSQAPLTVLAQVAGTSPQTIVERLRAQGLEVRSGQQSIAELVGPDLRTQIRILNRVLTSDHAR